MELKKYSAITDQGPYLNTNEDGYLYDLSSKLFVVADGFGGAGIGDVTTQKTLEYVKNFYGKISDDLDSTMPFFYNQNYLLEGNGLMNSLINTHQMIWKENKDKALNERGGCSLIALCQAESILISFCIGNLKQVLVRSGESYTVHHGQRFGHLTRDSYNSSLCNFPTTAIGMYQDFEHQIGEYRVREGDTFVVMTDGVYQYLSAREIEQVISSDRDLAEKSQQLLAMSNERGNLDNQTVLVLQY
jgi:serine/threonine protein phosphatase PrpC